MRRTISLVTRTRRRVDDGRYRKAKGLGSQIGAQEVVSSFELAKTNFPCHTYAHLNPFKASIRSASRKKLGEFCPCRVIRYRMPGFKLVRTTVRFPCLFTTSYEQSNYACDSMVLDSSTGISSLTGVCQRPPGVKCAKF